MPFQIKGLSAEVFAPFFALQDDELAKHRARIVTATSKPGYPCRVSLADAEAGERLLLINYTHLETSSPFRASHAIYVREGVASFIPGAGEVPPALAIRQISVRLFDKQDEIIRSVILPGTEIAEFLERTFAEDGVAFAHLHYAANGCFAAAAVRA